MNYEYIDNQGRPAPSSIVWGGRRIANPSETQLLAAGYRRRALRDEINKLESEA